MALRLQAALTACNVTTICNISCPRYSRSSGTKTWSSLSPVTQHMSTKSGMQINIYVLSDSPVVHLIWDSAVSLSRGNALKIPQQERVCKVLYFLRLLQLDWNFEQWLLTVQSDGSQYTFAHKEMHTSRNTPFISGQNIMWGMLHYSGPWLSWLYDQSLLL